MKKLTLPILLFGCMGLMAQSTFADKKRRGASTTAVAPNPNLFNYPNVVTTGKKQTNLAGKGSFQFITGLSPDFLEGDYTHKKVSKAANGIPVFMISEASSETAKVTAKSGVTEVCNLYLKDISGMLRIDDAEQEFTAYDTRTDKLGQTHIKMQQQFKGVPVFGSEVILHLDKKNQVKVFNGRSVPSPKLDEVRPSLSMEKAIDRAASDMGTDMADLIAQTSESGFEYAALADLSPKSELVIYAKTVHEDPKLAWHLTLYANGFERWEYFVDAKSGDILHKYNHTCYFYADVSGNASIDEAGNFHADADIHTNEFSHGYTHIHENSANITGKIGHSAKHAASALPPETATATDLNGINQRIETYSFDGRHFMIDASRPMFDNARSEFPNNTVGVIQTWNFDNQPVNTENPKYFHVTSPNGNWNNPNAVSAHYNAQISYEYFRTTFDRNSINGEGGSITSVINIADEDGGGFDNAFWNGQFMAYGNGRDAFSPLAGGLDVGGHEMSHGVIGNTANLTYQDESGAINESFADIFGTMIDRDDWLLGEDIVNRNVFASGAMRSMEDPHNGGNALGDRGWQPNNVSEQYRGDADNGGVHINSGIANYAFYLFATSNGVGKDKAEQIYYRALTTYLTASSQFVDLRLAVLQSATDIHGENSPEVQAAAAAFDVVGIQGGTPTPTDDTLPTVSGDEFILNYDLRDTDANTLYIADTEATEYTPISTTRISRKPSVSGDGSLVIFVTEDFTMNAITLSGDYPEEVINPQPVWGAVAISRDGSKVATIFNDETARVFVLDLASGTNREFELYNPTTAEGVVTGDVLYPDALEWDPTGEYLMYDALNEISNDQGDDFEYWDVGFIKVWDNQTNTYGDGGIRKLFTNLPEGVSIGNPTFAKTSADVIAFDLLDQNDNSYKVMTANIENGEVKTVWNNTKLGFPNYSRTDDKLLFDGTSASSGDETINIIDMQADRITASGNATVLIPDGKWGIWYTVSDGQAPTPPGDNDTDGDGVPDTEDQCPGTPAGTVVDATGCPTDTLPADQFTISTTGESCASSNDGSILVSAKTLGDYTATLTGNGLNGSQAFTQSIQVNDLVAGTYTVCVTTAGLPDYESCFDVVVDEPEALSVTAKMHPEKKTVTLDLSGGAEYTIYLEGASYKTSEASITLPLVRTSSKLTVRTDKDCQGVHQESLELGDKVILYPNPIANGEITVVLNSIPESDVQLQLSTPDGKVIHRDIVRKGESSFKIDVDALLAGMYILNLNIDEELSTYKIIKQ